MRRTPFILCSLIFSTPAFAHIGHVSELAGHSHVIVIGATIAAAVLAGLVAKSAKNRSQNDPNAKNTEADSAPETEQASA